MREPASTLVSAHNGVRERGGRRDAPLRLHSCAGAAHRRLSAPGPGQGLALGAAARVAVGVNPDVPAASEAMGRAGRAAFTPGPVHAKTYCRLADIEFREV